MKRRLGNALAALLAAASALPAASAEGIRLRVVSGVYGDTKNAGFSAPEGVAAADGRLAVADTGNGRIVLFAVGAEIIEAKAEFALSELPYPVRLAFAKGGDLLVLDGKLRRIGRVGPGGEFRGFLGLPPQAVPRSLRVDRNGAPWVLDVGRGMVVSLDAAGGVSTEIPLPPEPRRAFYADLTLGPKGEILVLDSVGRRVLVARAGAREFTPFGPPLEAELDFANSLQADDAGHVFVADQNGGGIVVLGADGSLRGRQAALGWKDGMLRYPSALAAEGGRLFVADRGNNRIEVFAVGP